MKFQLISLEKHLKSEVGQVVEEVKLNRFIEGFQIYKNKVEQSFDELKNENYHTSVLKEFLLDGIYKKTNNIHSKQYKGNIECDLVIFNGKGFNSSSGVLFEVKTPHNKTEMINKKDFIKKSLMESILYYLYEKIELKNNEVKNIVITNNIEWFIFDSTEYRKHFFNSKIESFFLKWRDKETDDSSTNQMYDYIESFIEEDTKSVIKCSYFNVLESKRNKEELISLYKLLSPEIFLKKKLEKDIYKLNKEFYFELLYIMGLEEYKDGNKKFIRRCEKKHSGSFIENCISILKSDNLLRDLPSKEKERNDIYFDVSLQLTLTWINRILFLKLLENQLITYHNNLNYSFLKDDIIESYDNLNSLFFKVLSVKNKDRNERFSKFDFVPYLNSSLFEPNKLEVKTLRISNLEDIEIPVYKNSKLKEKKLHTLKYLFKFLNGFHFGSSGKGRVEVVKKSLINSSVLGLIFEKINGYKEGSIYTPNYITTFMCRKTLRDYVVKLFNKKFGWKCSSIDEVYNQLDNSLIEESNSLIDNLKICDISVGSGHFLVSILNEIIYLKSDLEILVDKNGRKLKGYSMSVDNDELLIYDENGLLFEYKINSDFVNPETQRIQETIFNEKRKIIENCLFGVDINLNSVKICRLRLWIELLKNSYYKSNTGYKELETLPNIDINIKCGNSLVNKFPIDENLSEIFKKSSVNVKEYKSRVKEYKETKDRIIKENIQDFIYKLKLKISGDYNKKKEKTLQNKKREFIQYEETLENRKILGLKITPDEKNKLKELKSQTENHQKDIDNIKRGVIYKNSLEWRIDFPEILNSKGQFEGFDIVIGNPPYLYRNYDLSPYKNYFLNNYNSTQGNLELYKFFIERSIQLVKDTGIICQITSSSYLIQESCFNLRNLILDWTINSLIPLGPNSFEEVVVDTCILNIDKELVKSDNEIQIHTPTEPRELNNTTPYKIKQERFRNNWKYIFDYKMSDDEWDIYKYLEDNYNNISSNFELGVGINTGYIKNELVSDKKLDERYNPMVKGNGIEWYGNIRTEGWIMYDTDFVKSKGSRGRSLPDKKFFDEDKILLVRTRNISLNRRIISTIDTNKYYNLNRLSNIISKKGNNIYGLLGVLNSDLYNWVFSKKYFDYEIKPVYLEICPICNTNDIELVNLVRMLYEDTNNTEPILKRINEKVYSLYGLTENQVKIIKESIT